MKKFLLVLLLSASAASCGIPKAINGRSTANLTKPGIVALQTKEVVKVLDVIRDTATDGEAAKVISTATATKVVVWHREALLVIKDSPNGWKSAVLTGLANLKLTLPSDELNIIGPYINSAVSVIKAVVQ